MSRILLVDGNNQFFLKYAKATSYQDLVNRCLQMHWGFDQIYWVFDGFDSRRPNPIVLFWSLKLLQVQYNIGRYR